MHNSELQNRIIRIQEQSNISISSTRRNSIDGSSYSSTKSRTISNNDSAVDPNEVENIKYELAETKELLKKLHDDHREALELIVTMGNTFANSTPKPQKNSVIKRKSNDSNLKPSESFITPNRREVVERHENTKTLQNSSSLSPNETPNRRGRSGSIGSASSSVTSLQRHANRDRIDEYYQAIGGNVKEISIAITSPAVYIKNQREKVEKARLELKKTSHINEDES